MDKTEMERNCLKSAVVKWISGNIVCVSIEPNKTLDLKMGDSKIPLLNDGVLSWGKPNFNVVRNQQVYIQTSPDGNTVIGWCSYLDYFKAKRISKAALVAL
jgi:hypothetical protein